MPISTLVAVYDDETRMQVLEMLRQNPEFEIASECRTGLEAVSAIERLRPKLALLEVETPGLNGFQVLEAVRPDAPDVIFLTESSDHALRAFEVEAIDYLRKPISRERFEHALVRARLRAQKPAKAATFRPPGDERFLLRSEGRLVFVEPQKVDWIEASDNYVIFHSGQESHLVRMTMKALERSLDPKIFIRIHRSMIVNVDQVRELRGMPHGDYAVILRDGTELTMTRSYRHRFADLMPASNY